MKKQSYITIVGLFIFMTLGVGYAQPTFPQIDFIRIDSMIMSSECQASNFPPGLLEIMAFKAFHIDYDTTQRNKTDAELALLALRKYYSEPHLKHLYTDAQQAYVNSQDILQEINQAFKRLRKVEKRMPIPRYIGLHISGLEQQILVVPGMLSISIDYYLGRDYPVYQGHFSDWQMQHTGRERVAIDALRGWIMSEIPQKRDRTQTLRDYFKYWKRIYTILHKVFPRKSEADLFGFTPEQYKWLKRNRSIVMKNAEKRDEFNSPSPLIIDKYFREVPSGALLPDAAPRLIGPWLAYKANIK